MKRRTLVSLIVGIPVALVVLVLAGTFVYIHFIEPDPPARLTLDADTSGSTTTATATTAPAVGGTTVAGATTAAGSATTAGGAPAGGVEGTWNATDASLVGYRVNEVLFGQNNTAVGRTNAVTGKLTIAGASVSTADFSVDLSKVSSDEDRRDSQFRGRIMDVSSFPTATFTLTSPIDLGSIPANLAEVDKTATGDLTLRGTKKSVTFPIKARLNGDKIEVNGTIPIVFADWSIPNPSFAGISTEDHGELEFLLVFTKG